MRLTCAFLSEPELLDRTTHDQWLELGRPDVYSRARKKVESILAGPSKNPLPDAVTGQLEDILRRADNDLKEKNG